MSHSTFQWPAGLVIGLFAFMLVSIDSGAALAQISVNDDNGDVVTLEQPAQRIISLAPSMTELLFSLGAGDRIVGVMDFSDFPAQARQLPIVGRFDMLDMERIMALQPDLVVAWRSGNPRITDCP